MMFNGNLWEMDRAPVVREARQGLHSPDQKPEGGQSLRLRALLELVVRWEAGGQALDLTVKAMVTMGLSCQDLMCSKPFGLPT